MAAEKPRSTIEIIYELKEEIVQEAKKIAKMESFSAYALVSKCNELIALETEIAKAPQEKPKKKSA